MQTMTHTNYFELFGLAPSYRIDMTLLENTFCRLQGELHPDRHASHSENERRMALQMSADVNDAYRTLRHPVSRAQCLIRLAGYAEAENSATVSPAFLTAQMEWREAIEEASAMQDIKVLEVLARRLRHKLTTQENELAAMLDEQGDFQAAALRMNELRFYEKLRNDIDDVIENMESTTSHGRV